MLAYAYPDRTVMACDRKRRESFEAFNAAFAHFADLEETSPNDFHTSEGATTPVESVDGALKPQLANLTFVEGELDVLSPHVDSASLVLALHGCNEANKESMRMAVDTNALWCVMPCCIRGDLYLPQCTMSKMTDDQTVRVHVRRDGVRVRGSDGEVHRQADHQQGGDVMRRVRGTRVSKR
jgi:hypothetical protein